MVLTAREQRRVLGQGQRDLCTPDVLRLVSRQWEVFHIIVEQGSHCQSGGLDQVVRKWTGLLGQRALRLADYTRLPEVIVSAMQVNEGRDLEPGATLVSASSIITRPLCCATAGQRASASGRGFRRS